MALKGVGDRCISSASTLGWFADRRRRREEERAAALVPTLLKALELTMQSQAKSGEMVGQWISTLGDISVKRSAALLGSRGGRSTQRKKAVAKAVSSVRECNYCFRKRPLAVEDIDYHRANCSGVANGVTTDDLPKPE